MFTCSSTADHLLLCADGNGSARGLRIADNLADYFLQKVIGHWISLRNGVGGPSVDGFPLHTMHWRVAHTRSKLTLTYFGLDYKILGIEKKDTC
jgi:hypothetical protein